jgi:hypothetical protein
MMGRRAEANKEFGLGAAQGILAGVILSIPILLVGSWLFYRMFSWLVKSWS